VEINAPARPLKRHAFRPSSKCAANAPSFCLIHALKRYCFLSPQRPILDSAEPTERFYGQKHPCSARVQCVRSAVFVLTIIRTTISHTALRISGSTRHCFVHDEENETARAERRFWPIRCAKQGTLVCICERGKRSRYPTERNRPMAASTRPEHGKVSRARANAGPVWRARHNPHGGQAAPRSIRCRTRAMRQDESRLDTALVVDG